MADSGQNEPAVGHFMPEVGHPQRNSESPSAKACTNPDTPPTSCGQFQSTIRAQFASPEHNQSTMGRELPVDLQLIVGAWERLPDVVRAAIVGMVKGTVKGQ